MSGTKASQEQQRKSDQRKKRELGRIVILYMYENAGYN